MQCLFLVERAHALLESPRHLVGPLRRPVRVHPGGPAAVGLQAELVGPLVPEVDLAGEALPYGRPCPLDPIDRVGTDRGEVLGDRHLDGVIEADGLDTSGQPAAIPHVTEPRQLIVGAGSVVEVRRPRDGAR